MKNKNRQVRNILILPDFQISLIGYFVGLFIITTVSLYSTTYLFFHRLVQKGMNAGIPQGHIFYRFLDDQKTDLDWVFIGLALFNLILLLGVGFIISHRIAGPVYKLKKYLIDVTATSPDFSLRKKDFFKDIEPTINLIKGKLK